MRLAASNIAWSAAEDDAVAASMKRHGYEGVEVAPTRLFERPLDASATDVAAARRAWDARGLPIVAMQALLFGRPDLEIFGDEATREKTRRYLEAMVRLAAALGAEVLVFGSPKNRRVSGRPPGEVGEIARSFFGALGEHAATRSVVFCIEPNPPAYGCDFVIDADQGLAVVREVATPGFGLHLDAGGMAMTGADVAAALARAAPEARHFHASEPHLVPVGTGAVDHALFARGLAAARYQHWVSVEMRPPEGADRLAQLEASLAAAALAYGSAVTGAHR